jgi:hypothetical protein
MHGDGHIGPNIRHRRVDEIAVKRAELFGVVAAVLHLLAIVRIAQHGDEHFIELQIAAAGISEGAHRLFVGLAEIVEHLIELGIDLAVDRRQRRPAVERRRRRDGDLGRMLGVFFDELEVLDHRMAGKADLSRNLEPFVARGDTGEGDAGVHRMFLHAVETPEEIEMPPGAAKFTVGDRLQPGFFLFLNDALDLAVLDRFELFGRDLTARSASTRLLQRRSTQETPDMIGAEGRMGSLHQAYANISAVVPAEHDAQGPGSIRRSLSV